MKRIPLTVLAYEGPMARAYLELMKRAGYEPTEIILMVLSHHPVSGKKVGGFLPKSLRLSFAQRFQSLNQNFWARRLFNNCPELIDSICTELESTIPKARSIIKQLAGAFDYNNYSGSLQRILVKDLKDPELRDCLKTKTGNILFTGGGILPSDILSLNEVKFVHIHPGFLPHIRGADGVLWSVLSRNQVGASCFYMEPGLDVGPIIARQEIAPPKFTLQKQYDEKTLYRAIYAFFDPILRANLFVTQVLDRYADAKDFPATPQQDSEGHTYHFMHPRLMAKALETLFKVEETA